MLQATPEAGNVLHSGGSVPGNIRFVPGGVARNIAHNLAILGQITGSPTLASPILIAAVGDDAAGSSLIESCEHIGINIDGVMIVPGGATPSVSIIFDGQGDVAASVADVNLLETAITPQILMEHRRRIQGSFCVLIDGDLSQKAVEVSNHLKKNKKNRGLLVSLTFFFSFIWQAAARIARHESGTITWFEPVSAPKSTRAVHILPLLDYASPNLAELKSMAEAVKMYLPKQSYSHCTALSEQFNSNSSKIEQVFLSLRPLLQLVLNEGLGNVVLTLGGDGAALCTMTKDKKQIIIYHCNALPATVVNCSGAGDCLVSGFLYALAIGKRPEQALTYGIAAAKSAVESDTNVPASFSLHALINDADRVASGMKLYKFPCGCCCDACCKVL